MIESTKKPSDFLHDKGTNRLLADLVDAPSSLEADIEAAKARLAALPNVWYRSVKVVHTCYGDHRNVEYMLTASRRGEEHKVLVETGPTMIEAVSAIERAWTRAERELAIRERVEREVREQEAADAATKNERTPVTGGPTNDATTDALPNYYPHTEVDGAMEDCPDCGRPSGMHISNGKGGYRCATEKEAAKYVSDIAEE